MPVNPTDHANRSKSSKYSASRLRGLRRGGPGRPKLTTAMRLEREAQREWKERRIAALAEDAALNVDWVTSRLCSVAERCMQAEPVLDRKGQPTGEYWFDSSGANRSLELLGRHVGAFASDEAPNTSDFVIQYKAPKGETPTRVGLVVEL